MTYFIIYYSYSSVIRLEYNPFPLSKEPEKHKKEDFYICMLFGIISIDLLSYIFDVDKLSGPLFYYFFFVWCMNNKYKGINFFKTIQVKYLPIILLIIDLLFGFNLSNEIIGFSCGYIFYYLARRKIIFVPHIDNLNNEVIIES